MTNAGVAMSSPIVKIHNDLQDVVARWGARAAEWDRLEFSGRAATIARELMAEVEACLTGQVEARLCIREAALVGGCSERTISRMLDDGRLEDYGVKNAPQIRFGDLVEARRHAPVARRVATTRKEAA
jgi:hypothetical protein